MNLSYIKEGDIIIAPSYLHDFLRKQLLADKKGIANVTITTLSLFLQADKEDVKYVYYAKLQAMAPQLTYLKSSVQSLAFIQTLQKVITHMKQFQISYEQIQVRSPIDEEMKTIIAQLYEIPLFVEQMNETLKTIQAPLHHVHIIDYYHDIYEHTVINALVEKGAKRLSQTQAQPQKQWFYALNKRCEVESIAQYIIQQQMDAKEIKFTLLDKTYIPYIHLLFPQYQIPYNLHSDQERSFIQNKFIALLHYYNNPNYETSIALVNAHLFTFPYAKQTIDYMALYELDLHDDFNIVNGLSISYDVIDEREVRRLLLLEEKAKQAQQQLLPFIQQMEACETIVELLCFIDAFLIQTHDFKNKQDRKAILQIRKEIKTCQHILQNKEDIAFFISVIESIQIPIENHVEGIAISDLTHPLPAYKYHFILGASEKNYPAFQAFEGLFDEAFYDGIQFPDLETRYHLHQTYLSQQLYTSEHIIASYALSSFDGKANEASLALEQFFNQPARKLPLIENYTRYQRNYQISQQSAEKLYIKENILKGSVSSLERYANCPYSYFLRYGLKIEEPIDYTFSNAKAGTLTHAIFENLCKMYGKQYVEAKKEEVSQLLHEKVSELMALYPNKQAQLAQMQERLLTSIMQNLNVLKDHEQHSSLTPTHLEQKIEYRIPFKQDYALVLNGFIDRIDTNADFFRIIDYKSSPKSLKEEHVFSALQLQLITYLLIIEKQSNKRPLGAFYYSFANPNINMAFAKLKRRPLGYELFKAVDGDAYLIKEKKLSGWITSEYIEVMDDSGSHIKGVRNSKASGINTSTIYNSETLYHYMMNIYEQLAYAISEGNIACKSVSGACTYCPYAAVCANANHSYTKEEMVDVDDTLYVKGGR